MKSIRRQYTDNDDNQIMRVNNLNISLPIEIRKCNIQNRRKQIHHNNNNKINRTLISMLWCFLVFKLIYVYRYKLLAGGFEVK